MSKSTRVRAHDLRSLLRLANDLRDSRTDQRPTLLLDRMCDLLGAQVGILLSAKHHRPGHTPYYTEAVHGGWHSDAERATFLAYLDDEHAEDPMVPPLAATEGEVITRTRQQLVEDAAWYRSRHVGEYRKPSGMDHAIYSIHRLTPEGDARGIGLHRPWGEGRPFGRREWLMLHTFHVELGWMYREAAPVPIPPGLTPREAEVFRRLLTGESEKQIAMALSLACSTIHNHVTSVYRKAAVASRAELLARWVRPGSL